MQIRVKITRDGSNAVRTLDLEEYLRCVVPSEIPASSGQAALMAQAIIARTFAAQKIMTRANQPYDVDDTTSYQAYRQNNFDPRTDKAIQDTAGRVLYYGGKIVDTAVYSASNGGRTTSAKERWGSERAYLPAKDDPYDRRAGYKKNGHGVGMSQRGAQQMAKEGLSCQAILDFYYPGAEVAALTDSAVPTAKHTLRKGSRGDDVTELQVCLTLLGYTLDVVDGIFGAKTEKAVASMQKACGLAVDGIYGTNTQAAMETLLKQI